MAADLYNSLRWQVSRAAALARDDYRCTAVEHFDVVEDEHGGWTEIPVRCEETDELHVHHVERPEDGGDEFALDNLLTLCNHHHGRLHALVRANDLARAA